MTGKISAALACTLLMFSGPAWANMMIQDPWARATIGPGKIGAAYLTVMNHGPADRLEGASSPVASRVEFHTIQMAGNVAKMRRIDGLDLGMHATASLKPGGDHIMLMGLKAPLKAGDSFPLTLSFANAPDVTVNVMVRAAGAGGDPHDHGAGHKHHEMISIPAGPNAPTIDFRLYDDPAGGWNLHVMARNFRFAPENVNGDHVPGEGHAHIYANGKKIARLYGPWFHIPSLPDGLVELRVVLNANNHSPLSVDGEPLALSRSIHNYN